MTNPACGIPPHFLELDPADVRKALEGHEDVLAPEQRKADALYRQHRYCPQGCGPTLERSWGGTEFAFSDPSWHGPRCLMRCYNCGCTINPFDGMVVEVGDTDKARYGEIPIIRPDGSLESDPE